MSETRSPRPMPGHLRPVPEPRTEPSQRTQVFLWTFSVVLVMVAGSAFLMKLVEFFYTATSSGTDALASFLIPVLNYLMVAAGFFCLFLWAYSRGHFRDIEGPKYRMLEMQAEFDRLEPSKGDGGAAP